MFSSKQKVLSETSLIRELLCLYGHFSSSTPQPEQLHSTRSLGLAVVNCRFLLWYRPISEQRKFSWCCVWYAVYACRAIGSFSRPCFTGAVFLPPTCLCCQTCSGCCTFAFRYLRVHGPCDESALLLVPLKALAFGPIVLLNICSIGVCHAFSIREATFLFFSSWLWAVHALLYNSYKLSEGIGVLCSWCRRLWARSFHWLRCFPMLVFREHQLLKPCWLHLQYNK